MNRRVKRIVVAALTALGVAGLDTATARAQTHVAAARARFQRARNQFLPPSMGVLAPGFGAFPSPRAQQVRAGMVFNPFFSGAAGTLAANRLAGGLLNSAALSGGFGGFGGYGGYGYGTYVDSGGALYGAASIMNAQGQYKVS